MPARTYPWILLSTLSADEAPTQRREETRKMANRTLRDLYKLELAAQMAIEGSVGYAIFNNSKTHMWQVSAARGAGLAVNSETKQETFMKMIPAGAGLGKGVGDYRVVFMFESNNAMSQFLNSGWSGTAQADAAATASKPGGVYSGATEVAPDVWVYQITKKGLAPQVVLQGTKYYPDDRLNKQ